MSSANAVSIFDDLNEDYEKRNQEAMSLTEYLELCKSDKGAYATAPERLLKAIGEPEVIDTQSDPKLSRIFDNRRIAQYGAFKDFYGMEDTIGQIIKFLKASAQGLEESKQILYLLGPVGSAKSSLAERLKQLIEQEPFYALAAEVEDPVTGGKKLEISPINENPLGLFDPDRVVGKGESRTTLGEKMQKNYDINPRYMKGIPSPWAVAMLEKLGGDITKFKVVKRFPSKIDQIAVSKTEPGDENNQDISALVGKTNIRKLEEFDQDTSDAYSYSGGLCRGNRGVMEFVEMFKAPIKVLHPLLTATQEGNYNGTETIGAIPFDGLILAHSNESEWTKFRNNKENEAFISRTCIVRVPYTLQMSQEQKIYDKLLKKSALDGMPCAPKTLEMLAQWSVLTRLKEPGDKSNLWSKMKVYDGENLKDTDSKAKPIGEYRAEAGIEEGMQGMDTRFAFKTLSETFNFATLHGGEVAADPIHLMMVLEDRIKKEQLPADKAQRYIGFITEFLAPKYKEYVAKEINTAYLESYGDYGQNLFDKYILYADHWIDDREYRDPDTGSLLTRSQIEKELEKLEKPAGVANVKDFRNEVTRFVLRARNNNNGMNPRWDSYEKLRMVIEKSMFKNTDELMPVIAYGKKGDADAQKKHESFVERMVGKGYTPEQTRRVVEWYTQAPK